MPALVLGSLPPWMSSYGARKVNSSSVRPIWLLDTMMTSVCNGSLDGLVGY